VWVVRADVAGRAPGLVAYGTSAIVGPDGTVLACAAPGDELIVAEIHPPRVSCTSRGAVHRARPRS
jgi:predicted amidohydrolase